MPLLARFFSVAVPSLWLSLCCWSGYGRVGFMTRRRPGAVGPRAAAVIFLVVYRYGIIDYRYGNVKKVLTHLIV